MLYAVARVRSKRTPKSKAVVGVYDLALLGVRHRKSPTRQRKTCERLSTDVDWQRQKRARLDHNKDVVRSLKLLGSEHELAVNR